MFAGANDEVSRPVYGVEIAAPEAGPFPTSSGVRLVADLAFTQITNRRLARTDTLMTVGGEPGMRQELARGSVTAIVSRAIGRVPRIASVCTGTFFLAAAGVLDGRRAATHWSEVDALKRFRPAALVDGDAIHIEDGGVWTSAGVTAGMDLALAMIEADLGRRVELAIARRHVVFRIRPGGQSQFSEYDPDPPFASGHPDRASATVKTMLSQRYETARASFRGNSRGYRPRDQDSPPASAIGW